MTNGNVFPHGAPALPLFEAPRQKAFRAAVARTIRDLKSKRGLSNVELAETIGCCADTIGNAENENNDLSAIIILRLAFHYGEAAIDPIRELYMCRHRQSERSVADRLRDIIAEVEAA
jgi:predicted transcriptional regulator